MDQALLWTDGRYDHHGDDDDCDGDDSSDVDGIVLYYNQDYRHRHHHPQPHRHHNYFRYFIQAANQLDCQWKLMKMGEEGVRMMVMIAMVMVMVPKMGEEGVRNRIMSNEHEEECRWCR